MPGYQQYLDEKPAMRPFVELLRSPNAIPLPAVPIQIYFNSRFSTAVDYAMWGVKTPEQALRDLDRELEHELKWVLHDLCAQRERRQAVRP